MGLKRYYILQNLKKLKLATEKMKLETELMEVEIKHRELQIFLLGQLIKGIHGYIDISCVLNRQNNSIATYSKNILLSAYQKQAKQGWAELE